jgi:hypothetical protein
MVTFATGGHARPRRFSAAGGTAINTTGRVVHLGPTFNVKVSNEGAENVRLYTEEEDFDADSALTATDGFIVLAALSGFFEGPLATKNIWLRAEANTTDVVVMAFTKLG